MTRILATFEHNFDYHIHVYCIVIKNGTEGQQDHFVHGDISIIYESFAVETKNVTEYGIGHRHSISILSHDYVCSAH